MRRIDLVTQLIDTHPDLREFKDEKGRTLLMYLAFQGANQLLNSLLQRGVDVKEEDEDDLNAYDWAVLGSNFEGGTSIMKAMIK